MENKYYAVSVKFGHVGKHKFIIKTVAIKAESAKDAAYKARWMKRAKHHIKDAIIDVKELTFEQYLLLKEENKNDSYFSCTSIQEQKRACTDISDEIIDFDYEDDDFDRVDLRKSKIQHKNKVYKNLELEDIYMIRNYEFELAY